MQKQSNIIDCYNKTAYKYAQELLDELSKKHLDRILLRSFVEENKAKGQFLDLGCGPGQTTKFLWDCGIKNILGTDLSPEMIKVAKEFHPTIPYEVADMLDLKYANKTFGAVIAFYSIVHFDYQQLRIALKEIKRVLKTNGQLLFSFHIGTETVHLTDFFEKEVDIKFQFFEIDKIVEILSDIGFSMVDIIERRPYPDAEYPSRRAYIWVEK